MLAIPVLGDGVTFIESSQTVLGQRSACVSAFKQKRDSEIRGSMLCFAQGDREQTYHLTHNRQEGSLEDVFVTP